MKKAAVSTLAALVMLTVAVIAEAQQPSWTQSVLDPADETATRGIRYSALGDPFLIQVKDAFLRQTAAYPRGETVAHGSFLFVDINISNRSDLTLPIPRFTLQDYRGTNYLTAIRARRSRNAILEGELLNPGVDKRGYLVFDVPWLSGFESFPLRYQLRVADSWQTIGVNVYKKAE